MSLIINKIKRAVALAATFTLIAVNAPIAIAQTFNDVPTDHWAFDYIEQLVDEGVFDVSDNFRPNDALNRAELVKIVITAVDGLAGYEAPATPTFDDVAADAWFYDYVEAAVQLGIVAGYTDAAGNLTGKFGPSDTVNRAQATKILVNAFNVPTTLEPAGDFSDVAESAWFYPYVTTAFNQSILDGYDNGKFGPADPVTRAQVAKLSVNAQSPVERVAGEEGEEEGEVAEEGEEGEEEAAAAEEAAAEEETPAVSEGDLEVSLNDNTARASTVPLGASSVDLASFDFTAADDDVTVSSVVVTRGGVGQAVDWAELFLYDGVTRLTTGRTINSDTNIATFPITFKVDAGTTKTIRLVGRATATATAANDQHYFYLASAANVTSNAQSVAGDFPVAGSTFTLGGVAVNSLTLTVGTQIAQPLIGSTNAQVGSLRMQSGANNDVAIHNFTVTQNGTLATALMKTCKLQVGNNTVASVEGFGDRQRMTFVLETPFLIPEGQIKSWDIYCDLAGGRPTDTLQLYMDETSDIKAIDQQFGYGAAITNTSYTTTGVTAVTLKGGQVTITDNGPAAKQVAQNVTNIELLNYSVTADRALTVRDATVMIQLQDGSLNQPDVPTTMAATDVLDVAAALGTGGCAATNYNVDTTNAQGLAVLGLADMVVFVDGNTTMYGRVVSNDGSSNNGGLCVASSSNLASLTAGTATIQETNPYTFLENLRVIDADSGATLQGPLTTVNLGTVRGGGTNTIYGRQFTEDYELKAGTTRHISIKVDTDQFMQAGYQILASIDYTANAAGTGNQTGYIHDYEANQSVAVADIVGTNLLGKPMTVAANSLTVAVAASPNPSNSRYIKGQSGVESVGFNFTAGDAGDITIKRIIVRAVADNDGTFTAATNNLGDIEAVGVVRSVGLYDGNDLLAEPKGLTLVDGGATGYTTGDDYDRVQFDNLRVVVPAGQTKTIVARVNIQNSISGLNSTTPFFAAVYLINTDVTAEDKDANTVTAAGGGTVGVNGYAAATTNNHARVVRVENSGTLTVTQNSSPQSKLMIAGATKQLVSQYQFTASNEAYNVNELEVINDTTGAFDTAADTSAAQKVWIEYPDVNGVAQTVGLALSSGVANFSGLSPAMYVPKDNVAIIKVYADVQGTGFGQALSGQRFRLGLRDNNANSPDGTFRAVGAASGESTYNPSVTGASSVFEQIARFDVPILAKDTADTVLGGGDKDLYAVKVTAQTSRGVDVRRLVFRINMAMGAGDSISNFRVREKGGQDKETAEAAIVGRAIAATGAGLNPVSLHRTTTNFNLVDGAGTDGVAEGFVIVDFPNAITVSSAATKTFILKAAVGVGSAQNKQIATYIDDDTINSHSGGAGTVAKFQGCYVLEDPASGTNNDARIILDRDCDQVTLEATEVALNVQGIGSGTTNAVTAETVDFATQTGRANLSIVRGTLKVFDPDIATANDHYFWFDEDDDNLIDITELVVDDNEAGDNASFTRVNATTADGFDTASTLTLATPCAATCAAAPLTMGGSFLIHDINTGGAGQAVAIVQSDIGDNLLTAGSEVGIDLLGDATDATTILGGALRGYATLPNFVWSDKSSTNPAHGVGTTDWASGYVVDTLSSATNTLSY